MLVAKELREIADESGYGIDAFLFVQRGLDHTVKSIHGEQDEEQPRFDPETGESSRHVSGAELCHGLKEYAIDRYGLLARSVLRRWRITRSEDFGQIVFAMVNAGLMQKTDEDTIDDFMDVFDFAQAFTPELMLTDSV